MRIQSRRSARSIGSYAEGLVAEEACEALQHRRGHVGMRRRSRPGLYEEVAVLLEEILIRRTAAVIEEGLLVGPGRVVDQRVDLRRRKRKRLRRYVGHTYGIHQRRRLLQAHALDVRLER